MALSFNTGEGSGLIEFEKRKQKEIMEHIIKTGFYPMWNIKI